MSDERLKCFVLSPIGADDTPERRSADTALNYLIRKALEPRFAVTRADEDNDPGEITPRMISAILDADLIVADMSGHNPNVFYEVAIAHGYRKATVHIQREGEKIAFDVKDMRVVLYDTTDPAKLEAAQKQLRQYADYAVANTESLTNPLINAGPFLDVRTSKDPVAESNVQVMTALARLRQEVRRAIEPISSKGDNSYESDVVATTRIINRIRRAGRAEVADFENCVTLETSSRFDNWARKTVARLLGLDPDAEADDPAVSKVIMDVDAMFEDVVLDEEDI